MKKGLLYFGIAACFASFNASAQLALENFNAGVLPAGWVLINDGHTVISTFTTVPGLPASLTASAWVPVIGAGVAGDYQMITTSDFSPAATADRWLITPAFTVTSANTVLQWDDDDLGSGEGIEVKISPTAGTTAPDFTANIYSAQAGVGGLITHQLIIGSYMGSSIRVAFRDTTHDNWGLLVDNVQATVLPSLDLGVTAVYLPPFAQTGSSNAITGVLHNYGVTTTTSVNLNYSVNGGTPVVSPLTGLTNAIGSDYTYTSATPWVPATAGTYTIKVWADNINGPGVDENHANDTMSATVLVIDTLQPKMVMLEEFTQASCDPCADAAPNVDSVYANNQSNSVLLRYHVNFPGRDCMDTVTLTSFVEPRRLFYDVNGVPDAQVDGQYVYPGAAGPGSFSSDVIRAYASFGSPFKITVTPSYNNATHTYSYSATIKSYGPIAAGMKAYAALAVDNITYANNQSTESIPQTVFPEVAENMFPTASGTALAAFTTGSTQTVTGTWTKNRRWGSDFAHWSYDSSLTGKIIVWVQDDVQKYIYQAAYGVVATGPLAVNNVASNNGSLELYPNPASKTATVELGLKAASDVKMEVYNVLGQIVYSMPIEHRNVGTSLSAIDVSSFAAGDYFVKISVSNENGNELFTKTLTIAK